MSNTAQIALITTIAGGGFALTGAWLNNRMAIARDQSSFRRETAFELADSERLMWGDSWIDLNINAEHVATRRTAAGVPVDLITSLDTITRACWRSNREVHGWDDDGEEVHGITSELLDARRAVVRAAGAYLLCTGTYRHRSRLLLAAIDEVERATAPTRTKAKVRCAGGKEMTACGVIASPGVKNPCKQASLVVCDKGDRATGERDSPRGTLTAQSSLTQAGLQLSQPCVLREVSYRVGRAKPILRTCGR